MTSSAKPTASPAWLDDFLALTLRGTAPALTDGYCAAGAVRWAWLDEGIVQLEPARGTPRQSVLLSVGIHGDETAPIELLVRIVRDLARGVLPLACRVLVVLGNPAAMRAGQRYLEDDLNRLFNGHHALLPGSREAPRAARLESVAAHFFADAARQAQVCWHIDMHTAIRASVFERFALLPHTGVPPAAMLFDWLRAARIAAVLLHTAPGDTFSHFTAARCGAFACTLELGKVLPFGQNDLTHFAGADDALRRHLAGAALLLDSALAPRVFTVIDQITKHSDAFTLFVAPDVPNFTPFTYGTLLARDGDYRYMVRHEEERIVFPNPTVKPGLRAGLMVTETPRAPLASAI